MKHRRAIGPLGALALLAACTGEESGVPRAAAGGATTASGGVGGQPAGGGGGRPGGAGGTAGAGGAAQGPCPADMVPAGASCVDRFEAPNLEGGPPLAMQTAYDGEDWCQARGKRLCTEAEWVRACQGAAGHPYPYGDSYQPHRCNDDKTWIAPDWGLLAQWPSPAAQAEADKLYQAEPSGSRSGCLSHDGAFDLTGNVAEWVVRTDPNSTNYDQVLKGCYWAGCYGGSPPSCGFVNPAHPGGFRSYEAGFRCCRDLAGR